MHHDLMIYDSHIFLINGHWILAWIHMNKTLVKTEKLDKNTFCHAGRHAWQECITKEKYWFYSRTYWLNFTGSYYKKILQIIWHTSWRFFLAFVIKFHYESQTNNYTLVDIRMNFCNCYREVYLNLNLYYGINQMPVF